MKRSWRLTRLFGVEVDLHWTTFALPLFLVLQGIVAQQKTVEIVFRLSVLGCQYLLLLAQEICQLLVARWLGLPIRDVTMTPLGGIPRLACLSDRPWKEIWIGLVGPLLHIIAAAGLAVALLVQGHNLSADIGSTQDYGDALLKGLFWLNVAYAIFECLPAFPADGARILRAILTLSRSRLRATDTVSLITSLVALILLIPGVVWVSVLWWLIILGIVVHISGQQELISATYFASLQEPLLGGTPVGQVSPVPMDQVMDDGMQPDEPNFSGMLWNQRTRLWVVWRDGKPVSVHALIGE